MNADSKSAAGGLNILISYGYDGTGYFGSQVQPGRPTVSGAIEDVLAILYGRRIALCAASRTDRGAHARRTIANFWAPVGFGPKPTDAAKALNAYLPADVRILKSFEVARDFNSRFHSIAKEYRYRFREGKAPEALEARYRAHFNERSDRSLLADGLALVRGTHSFERFCRRSGEKPGYDCTIHGAKLKESGSRAEVRITGSRFLYQMVRRLAGSLHDLGTGKLTMEEFRAALFDGKPLKTITVAPACGLVLWDVYFSELNDEQNNSYE